MTRTIVIGIVASLLLVGSAQAGLVVLDGIKDVSAFDYGYEADALPAASTPAWTRTGNSTESVTGSILRVQSPLSGYYVNYTIDATWNAFIAADGPAWTVETSAKIAAGMTRGLLLGAGLGTTSNPNSRWVSIEVKSDRVELNGNTVSPIWLGDNTAAFHTYRIVADSGALFYNIYRDDVLIKEDAATTARMWAIRFGTPNGPSDSYVDYVRWTGGAWAPIPEPATLAVLLCGVAIMSLRRRR